MNSQYLYASGKIILAAGISALMLSACGDSGKGSASAPSTAGVLTSGGPQITLPGGTKPVPPIAPIDPVQPPAETGAILTKVYLVDKAGVAQTAIPITFGHVFAKGALPANTSLTGLYNGAKVPLQTNIKATHADGSARHAVISAILPQLNAGETVALALAASPPMAIDGLSPVPGTVLGGFDSVVNLNLGGQLYSASAAAALKLNKYKTWLAGPVATEWQVSMPFKNAAGIDHPHLAARFALRRYSNGKLRVDLTVENNQAYEPDPKNVTYDAEVLVNGQRVYAAAALTHFHHARWRKLFWAGDEPKVHLKHDSAYLIASQAVPNYDQSVIVPASALSTMKTRWDASNTGPMGMAMFVPGMGTTGGRPDIGLHHGWAASYVLSMDERAKEITLGLSDLGGSWPIHYRDRKTDLPVSIVEYPYVSTRRIGSDSYNPVTKLHEDLPVCTAAGQCTVPYAPDTSHQPSMAYLPYLVTGDTYHLDELLFWSNWNLIAKNPGYRGYAKGIISGDQVRGQAWTLRTLAQTAYLTPDAHPLKAYFTKILDTNLDWYNAMYAAGTTNNLGFIDHNTSMYAVAYPGPEGANAGVAPWMDDFFTSAAGHTLELGFTKVKPLLDWKARFPVGRMMAPGYCWIDGAVYALQVRNNVSSPYYATFAEAYKMTMRTPSGGEMVNSTGKRYLDQPCASQAQADWRSQADKDNNTWRTLWLAGEMTGYASSQTGYPSNMQPALAVAATTGIPNAKEAWAVFMSRSVKPNYGLQPQFAIVPRQ